MKKKMSEGGDVDESQLPKPKEGDEFTEGVKDGMNHDLDSVKNFLENVHKKFISNEGDNGNLKGLQNLADKKAKGYADGGEIDPADLPQPEMDWKDKLKIIMDKMTNSPAASIMGAVTDPVGTTMRGAAAAAPTILQHELPPVQQLASSLTSGAVPPPQAPPIPQPQPQPMAQQMPPPQASPAPVPQAALSPAQPTEPSNHPGADILQKLTDGDGAKMSALLASLKDQDKRNQFAQALAVIGDTFGNIGRAKAGMPGEGFKTAKMLSDMNKESKSSQIENLTQSLAADPNSNTSRMAQATLMQSMGIKPGDPREAKIRAMPAMSITQLMPQMTDAVKNNIEKEKNMIEAGRATNENTNKKAEIGVQQQNADKALQATQTTAASDILKNTSGLRDLLPGRGPRDIAKETLERNMGNPSHGVPDLGSTFNGHKVLKVTRVK
jgi:hypothetical protein